MFSHTAPFVPGMQGLRNALHLPQTHRRPAPAAAAPAPWLERLAAWAERQPMHHRMGSCSRL